MTPFIILPQFVMLSVHSSMESKELGNTERVLGISLSLLDLSSDGAKYETKRKRKTSKARKPSTEEISSLFRVRKLNSNK